MSVFFQFLNGFVAGIVLITWVLGLATTDSSLRQRCVAASAEYVQLFGAPAICVKSDAIIK